MLILVLDLTHNSCFVFAPKMGMNCNLVKTKQITFLQNEDEIVTKFKNIIIPNWA